MGDKIYKNFDLLLGNEYSMFHYNVYPEKNYDRLSKFPEFKKGGLQIELSNNKKIKLDKQKYTEILNNYANEMGFSPILHIKLLQESINY